MICRVWHGWTTPQNADSYERLLRSEITIMWFDSVEAVRVFAGPDYEVAVVPPAARQLLQRFDERSAHCEVRERRSPSAAFRGPLS